MSIFTWNKQSRGICCHPHGRRRLQVVIGQRIRVLPHGYIWTAAQYPGRPLQSEHTAISGGGSQARTNPVQTAQRQGVWAATQKHGAVHSGQERSQVGENVSSPLTSLLLDERNMFRCHDSFSCLAPGKATSVSCVMFMLLPGTGGICKSATLASGSPGGEAKAPAGGKFGLR